MPSIYLVYMVLLKCAMLDAMKHFISLGLISTVMSMVVAGCVNIPTRPTLNTNTANQNFETVFNSEVELLGTELQEASDELIFKNSLQDEVTTISEQNYYYPMADYQKNLIRKPFGQFIPNDGSDRFYGYHTGDDIEVVDLSAEVPVYALTDAKIVRLQFISGYGGVLILEFSDRDDVTYHALYGHIDLTSVPFTVGQAVRKGEQIAILGDHESVETDGERKHLHFGIYPFSATELYAGYVGTDSDLIGWSNPADFLRSHYAQEPGAVDESSDISETLDDVLGSVDGQ